MNNDHNQGIGPMIGAVIIVLLLLVGGYYSLQTGSVLSQVEIPNNSDQPLPVINMPAKPPQESTEISDIEADALAVDMTTIDSGLDNLDLLIK